MSGLSSLTLSCWFQLISIPSSTATLIGEGWAGINALRITTSGDINFRIEASGGTVSITDGNVSDNEWHFALLEYDGTNVNFYLDDVDTPSNSGTTSGTLNNVSAYFAILAGQRNTGVDRGGYTNANICNVYLSSAATTSQLERENIKYNKQTSNLLHWPCPEGNETTIYDVSGNSNHSTAANITWTTQSEFHYNVINGFDKYLDDATSTVDLYVPYIFGTNTPAVTSVTNYTKQSSNPAGYWHNGAETQIVVGADTYDGTGWVVADQSIFTDDFETDDLVWIDGSTGSSTFTVTGGVLVASHDGTNACRVDKEFTNLAAGNYSVTFTINVDGSATTVGYGTSQYGQEIGSDGLSGLSGEQTFTFTNATTQTVYINFRDNSVADNLEIDDFRLVKVDNIIIDNDPNQHFWNSTTGYAVELGIADFQATWDDYAFMDVSDTTQYKNFLLYKTGLEPTFNNSVAVYKFIGQGDNIVVDGNGEYVFDGNGYATITE